MTVGQIRLIKWILSLILIGFGGVVGAQLYESFSKAESVIPDLIEGDDGKDAISRQVEITQLDSEGRSVWRLLAAESIGRTDSGQMFRDVEIHIDVGRDKVPVVITADHCVLTEDETAHFEGNVVIRDNASMRLEADVLDFSRYPDELWTEKPVKFFREDLAGDAGSMRYIMTHGEMYLDDGVDMTLHRGGEDPVRIRSASAIMRGGGSRIQFVDDVFVRQKTRSLACNDLQLTLGEGDKIEHVEAFENVELRIDTPVQELDEATAEPAEEAAIGAGEAPEDADPDPLAGLSTDEPGVKRLLSHRVDLAFRAGTELLKRVRASDKGHLIFEPPRGEGDGFRKELEGNRLIFDFDEQGRLAFVRGRGGVTLTLTPVDESSNKVAKKITARQIESEFDPETGELIVVRCLRAVHFEQEDVQATADTAIFELQEDRLTLEDEPKLWDSRASMEARTIVIDVATGDTRGDGDVRTTASQLERSQGIFPGGDESDDEPIYFVADELRYTEETKIATYLGSARGFQGDNRIEANRIRIYEEEGVLEARGKVRTVFVRPDPNGEEKPSTTLTESGRFDFRRDEGVLRYRRAVSMKNQDMTLNGSRLDVTLGDGGQEIVELLAEGDVEIKTPGGEARGSVARYLPKEESITITGENASLRDGDKVTEGKELTFFLSNDRHLVDGHEQARTKTTYSSKRRPF